jgi:hypothetical protein
MALQPAMRVLLSAAFVLLLSPMSVDREALLGVHPVLQKSVVYTLLRVPLSALYGYSDHGSRRMDII